MKTMKVSIGKFCVPIVSKISDSLCCLLCSNVLVDPYQGPCGCRFCYQCINDYLQEKERICPGQTEYCLTMKLNMIRDFRQDRRAKREMDELILKCPLMGCKEECEMSIMKTHLTGCAASNIDCGLCEESIVRGEYENHCAVYCKDVIVNCEDCHKSMKRIQLEQYHHNYDNEDLCHVYSEFCPNQCGEAEKVVWAEHRRMCIKTNVVCPYHTIGCTSQGMSAMAMSKHMVENGFNHAEMLLKHVDNLNNEISFLNVSLVKITNERDELSKRDGQSSTSTAEAQHTQISTINHTIDNMRRENLKILPQVRSLIKSEISHSNQSKYFETVDRMNDEMKKMRAEIDSLKSQLSNSPLRGFECRGVTPAKVDPSEEVVKPIASKEVALFWKIRDFSQIHELFSPRFYTNVNGYKMSLNVEKKVKGFLSIYAQLRAGEHDDNLVWPFRKYLTVRILDQDRLGRDYERFIIFNEKAGDACDRKFCSQTGDFGHPKFISYDDLKQKSYLLRNNKLLIHCFVEELKTK